MEQRRVAIFTFNSDPVVFAHALLNGLNMQEQGWVVKVIIEGEATKQVALLRNETKPFADLWQKAKKAGIVDCVCQACARKNTVVPAVIEQGLKLCGEMLGHPAVSRYLQDGYEVLIW